MTSSFGETLRSLRKAHSSTQVELAEGVGVSHVYISALERGDKSAPRYALVMAIADFLEVDAELLWSKAQEEREARLRAKIIGEPTSRRTPKKSSSTPEGDVAETTKEILLLEKLRDIASDDKERARIVKALNALLDILQD